MQTAPAGFDAAIAARNALTVAADVPASGRGGNLTAAGASPGVRVVVTRELAGELPKQATLVEGSAQSHAVITLDGRMTDVSPLVEADQEAFLKSTAAVAAGYAGLTVPLFTGTIREFGTDEGERSLTLSARDAADRLAAPARVPLCGAYATRLTKGAPKRHPVNTQAIVTSILHTNDIRMTPRPRSGVAVSVPGVGGWLADVGWTYAEATGNAGSAPFEAGRFGLAVPNTGEVVRAVPERRVDLAAGRVVQIEAWLKHTTGVDRLGFVGLQTTLGGTMYLSIEANRLYGYVRRNGMGSPLRLGAPAANLSAGWHHVCVQFTYASSVTIYVDGAPVSVDSTPWGLAAPDVALIQDVVIEARGGIQDVKMHHAVSGAGVAAPTSAIAAFTPEADLDAGLIDVEVTPNLDGAGSWDALKALAAAELGMVGFSESGRFYFRNQATLAAPAAPVATWDFDYAAGVGGSVTLDSVRSAASATRASAVLEWAGLGNATEATTAIPSFLADEVLEIGLGLTSYLLQGEPFVPLAQEVRMITARSGAWTTGVGWVLCRNANGSTRHTGAAPSAWLTPVDQSTWRLNVQNDTGFTLYAAWPTEWDAEPNPYGLAGGAPALWVNGLKRVALPESRETVTNAATEAAWGKRVIDLGSSAYWQRADVVRAHLGRVVSALSKPRAQLTDVSVPADPRWQLGDAIVLHDNSGAVPDITARITRSEITLSLEVEGGMIGRYELRQVNA